MIFAQQQSVDAPIWTRITEGLDALFTSPLFVVLKFFAALYVAVLIVNVILLLILNNARKEYRKSKRGANVPTRGEMRLLWRRIMRHLKGDDVAQYKIAILKADRLAERVLTDAGYKGATMRERIAQLEAQKIGAAAALARAHAVCARVVQEPDFMPTRAEAEEALAQYKAFFDDFYLFE